MPPDELVQWLEGAGMGPPEGAAARYWQKLPGSHPAAARCAQPLFLYGDAAEYNRYGDKVLGVYLGR